MRISVVNDLKPSLGESPVWDVETQRLYWVDSQDGRVFRHDESGGDLQVWDLRKKIGSIALRRSGDGLIAALQDGVYSFDLDQDELVRIIDPEAGLEGNRLNDGKTDSRGRFVFGSMDMAEDEPAGRLYSMGEDLKVQILDEGIICSNGPCWSPDETVFYFADTWTGEIWAYDYDIATGSVANRRVFATVDRSDGGAVDGMTVDSEGFVWQAHVYGGKLNRFDPDGKLERQIEMPVKKVTCPTFGGPDLDRLYVTSMARPPLPRFPEDGPLRGALLVIDDLGIQGVAAHRFAV